jgi:microcystin-dependent protein
MTDQFVAEIRMFGFNFPPTGWAFCNGQLLPISQNTALFSLLGTYYGGDGKSTFGLPDVQGSAPLAWGSGSGLSARALGETGGEPFVTLIESEMPTHNHSVSAAALPANVSSPAPAATLSRTNGGNGYHTLDAAVQLDPNAIAVAGGSLPHNNLMPYLMLNFCIAMQGIYPPRS